MSFARRDFLKLTSLAAFGVAGSWPSLVFAAGQRAVSVGYTAAEPVEGAEVWLESADALLSGDPTFISRSARVTVRTLLALASDPSARTEASIDVVYPAFGYQPEHYPTYRAWSWRQDDVSAPVAFEVPVDGTHGLQLVLTQFTNAKRSTFEPEPFEKVLLTVGSSSSTPKLRQGLYALAYREDGSQGRPNWANTAIVRRDGKFEVRGAPFSYVILSVDYAS